MKFREFLSEKWEKTVKFYDETYEIFKNPTKSELNSIESVHGRFKSVRAIILPNGDAYVFDEDYLHEYAIRALAKLKGGVKVTIMLSFDLIQLSVDEEKEGAVDTVVNSPWVMKNFQGFRVEYPNRGIVQYVESYNNFKSALNRIAESITQEK